MAVRSSVPQAAYNNIPTFLYGHIWSLDHQYHGSIWIVSVTENVTDYFSDMIMDNTVLEITVGHQPFSDQFQHLADQNPFLTAIFPVHFQWNSNQ